MDVNKLLGRIQGKSAEEQAKMIATFVSNSKRKQTVEEARRDVRSKLFTGFKKQSKAQQESYIYEYLAANPTWFQNWLKKKHEELIDTNVKQS